MLKPQTFGCMFALVTIISFTLLINVNASVSSICPDASEYGANNCTCRQAENKLVLICYKFQANQTMTFARSYNFSSIVFRDLENVDVILGQFCLNSSQNCITSTKLTLVQKPNSKIINSEQFDQLVKFPTEELNVVTEPEIKQTINLRNMKPSIEKIGFFDAQQLSIPFGPNHGFLESFPQLDYMKFKDVHFVEDTTNLTITELSPTYIEFDNTNLKGTFSFTPKTCDPDRRIYIKLKRNKDLTHFNFESLFKGTNVTQCKYKINLLEGNFVPNFLHDHVHTLEKYMDNIRIKVDKIIECNCKLLKFNQRNALVDDDNFCNNSQTFLNQSQNGDNKEQCQE